jgi:glycosyltransferase involved in cell wall biosynthesis
MAHARKKLRVAFIGTVGLPAAYSGFETLAEYLVRYNEAQGLPHEVVVYCSKRAFKERPRHYHGAELRYVDLDANNASSILYDAVSMISALRQGVDTILLLGVSGAIALPLVRAFSSVRVVTNIDGIEWRREKWQGIAKWVLRTSERLAVRWSHHVVADNAAIVDYVRDSYGAESELIAYGGDHALAVAPAPYRGLPDRYALALCRIEPENNVHMILAAFAEQPALPLVFIGNWDRSEYGRELKRRYADSPSIRILDPIYDVATLRSIRQSASFYVHGHSAGGTNPSLVEMMHFGVATAAFDCVFNRKTTHDQAFYFSDAAELSKIVAAAKANPDAACGEAMLRLAREHYTWDVVGKAYFDLICGVRPGSMSG